MHTILVITAFLTISQVCLTHANLTDIIGGKPVIHISEFPYQVALRVDGQFTCGGVILDPFHILTAAHCVCDDDYRYCPITPSYYTIVAGSTTLDELTEEGVEIEVETIFVHEEYISRLWVNDVAVLRLAKSLLFGKEINSISLAESTPKVGTPCMVSGWGKTDKITGTASNHLMAVNVSIIDHNECSGHFNLYPKMLCTEVTRKGPFQGDSGGPLKCDSKLAGIVSFGSFSEVAPSGYTDVFRYKDWIEIQVERTTSNQVGFNLIHFLTTAAYIFVYSYARRILQTIITLLSSMFFFTVFPN